MDRQDLLCGIKHLQNKQGLERKAFIRTATQTYPSNRLLSKFEMYFIFAEKPQWYLLGDKYNLLMGPPLIGWVNKNKIIPWNTRLQISPKNMLKFVYAYTDLQATKNQRIKIIGGKSWYKLPLHLPLLDIVSDKLMLRLPLKGADIPA